MGTQTKMANLQQPGSAPKSHRREWDATEFERKALERIEAEQKALLDKNKKEPPVKRELLKRREYKVDLDSKLGKTQVITKVTPASQQGGYYCNVCDCVVKDSINFLDHINGKKHQRNLGMSMRIERSSLDQVKNRFAKNKAKLEEKKVDYDFDQRMMELKEEEEKQKEYRKNLKRKRKPEPEPEEMVGDPDMMAMMGFSGFGTSS